MQESWATSKATLPTNESKVTTADEFMRAAIAVAKSGAARRRHPDRIGDRPRRKGRITGSGHNCAACSAAAPLCMARWTRLEKCWRQPATIYQRGRSSTRRLSPCAMCSGADSALRHQDGHRRREPDVSSAKKNCCGIERRDRNRGSCRTRSRYPPDDGLHPRELRSCGTKISGVWTGKSSTTEEWTTRRLLADRLRWIGAAVVALGTTSACLANTA